MWSDDERRERLREADARAALQVYGVLGSIARCNREMGRTTEAFRDLSRSLRIALRDMYDDAGHPYGDIEAGFRRWTEESDAQA